MGGLYHLYSRRATRDHGLGDQDVIFSSVCSEFHWDHSDVDPVDIP